MWVCPEHNGDRPLKRTLQKRVLDPLALGVLQGDFGEGDTVNVDGTDGKIALHRVVNSRA